MASQEDRTAGAKMVLRDDHGAIIFSSCQELRQCASPSESEIAACLEGVSLVLEGRERIGRIVHCIA